MTNHGRPGGAEDINGELFTREGLVPTVEATTGEAVVGAQERAARLFNALEYYDAVELQESYLQMAEIPEWRNAQKRRYGEPKFEAILANKQTARDEIIGLAKNEFYEAWGVSAVVNNGLMTREQAEEQAGAEYVQFEAAFRGSSVARHEKRHQQQAILKPVMLGDLALAREVSATYKKKAAPLPEDLRARITLRQALRPDFIGLSATHYEKIDIENPHVSPASLRKGLLEVGSSSTNSVGFRPDGEEASRKHERVTVTPAEWSVVLRSSADYRASHAINVTKEKHRKLGSQGDHDAPRRAGIHIIEAAESNMQAYLQNVLTPHGKLIDRFLEAGNYNANLARFGTQANMIAQMSYLWEYVIKDMVYAVGASQGWDQNQEKYTYLALEKAALLVPDESWRLKNFTEILKVAKDWNEAKENYVRAKLAESAAYITKHQTTDEFNERSQQKRLQNVA